MIVIAADADTICGEMTPLSRCAVYRKQHIKYSGVSAPAWRNSLPLENYRPVISKSTHLRCCISASWKKGAAWCGHHPGLSFTWFDIFCSEVLRPKQFAHFSPPSPSNLDLWLSDLKIALPIIHDASFLLSVRMCLLFGLTVGIGQTDGRTDVTRYAALWERAA